MKTTEEFQSYLRSYVLPHTDELEAARLGILKAGFTVLKAIGKAFLIFVVPFMSYSIYNSTTRLSSRDTSMTIPMVILLSSLVLAIFYFIKATRGTKKFEFDFIEALKNERISSKLAEFFEPEWQFKATSHIDRETASESLLFDQFLIQYRKKNRSTSRLDRPGSKFLYKRQISRIYEKKYGRFSGRELFSGTVHDIPFKFSPVVFYNSYEAEDKPKLIELQNGLKGVLFVMEAKQAFQGTTLLRFNWSMIEDVVKKLGNKHNLDFNHLLLSNPGPSNLEAQIISTDQQESDRIITESLLENLNKWMIESDRQSDYVEFSFRGDKVYIFHRTKKLFLDTTANKSYADPQFYDEILSVWNHLFKIVDILHEHSTVWK